MKQRISSRSIAKGLAVLIAAMLLGWLVVGPSHGQGAARVKIGWNYHMGNAPAVVADEGGLFRKHGLDAEVKVFPSGPVLSQALATKEIDIAYVGFAPAYGWLDRDLPTVAVAQSSYGLASILVRKDSGISSLADLRGKTVAGSRKGSGNDVLLRAFLLRELAKLDPDKDVQLVALPAETQVTPLMERKVDAVMALEPFATAALATDTVKALVNTVDVASRHPWYLVVARADFLKQNRETVVRVVRAHVEAVKLLNTSPNEGADVIARAFKLTPVTGANGRVTQPAEIVRQARERVGFDYEVTEKEMAFFERQIGWAKSLGFVKGAHKAGDLFDPTVLRDALSGK